MHPPGPFAPVLRPRAAALAAVLLASCTPATDGPRLYHAEPRAPSYTEASLAALDHLGPSVVDKGVNFSVYSEHATRLEVLLFDDPEALRPTRQFAMTRFGDAWNVHVEGVGYGQHYGYVAWGPNWEYDPTWVPGTIHGFKSDVDAQGNRFNPNKLLMDPYAKAVHRDHDWSKGSTASGPARTESTWAAAGKSIVVRSEYAWSAGETEWRTKRKSADFAGHGWNDLVVYEVHVKGFTADPASAVEHPGTYLGFGEKADYFKDLGITAVELMPIHEKPLDGGYWGYQNLNFFSPELSYASTKEPRLVIDEFKGMVDQLHQKGIEVIIDVVYNHTGEGGLWREKLELNDYSISPGTDAKLANFDPHEVAGLYSFRGLDNAAYYALSPDGLNYWNNTGVGNQCRANHTPMRRMILDSLRFYAEELHVDGFRFDLAPVLGDRDGDYNDWPPEPGQPGGERTILHDVIDDDVLLANNVRIIAEPWAAGGFNPVKLGRFPSTAKKDGVGWYEWNARFRDTWRSFVNDDNWKLNSREADADIGFVMTGSDSYYKWNNRRPYHTTNFITVHDGFTMYDLFSYAQKQNKCGPLNPVCCATPLSAWCDKKSGEDHNRSRNWGDEPTKRQMMRNLFTAMMISHGTPLILGGDEWMRTQLGNNNAYSSGADNPTNWFQWGNWTASNEKHRMHDFVRQIVKFRKSHAYAFAPSQYGEAAPFSWKDANNGDAVGWGGRHVMQHYYDATKGPELAILINMERGPVTFKLPSGRTWKRVVDTQNHFDTEAFLQSASLDFRASANIDVADPVAVTGGEYATLGTSIVILEAQ